MEELGTQQKIALFILGRRMVRPVNTRDPSALGMDFETRRVRCPAGHELELWRVRVPSPRAVAVMLHGYAVSKEVMLEAAQEFAALGCEPWLVDLRGSGGSDGDSTSLGFHDAEDLEAIAWDVRQCHGGAAPPVTFYGQSMGAVAAIRAVHLGRINPAVLILEAPFDSLLNAVRNRFALLGLPVFPAAHLLVFWGGLLFGSSGFAHRPSLYARNVRTPVLLMQGDQDRRVTPQQAEVLYAAFPGPRQLIWFPGAGHESLQQYDSRLWRESVDCFFKEMLKTDD
ncbi:alpha/beta fold hydrolase [Candidatus Sumerlaeota bacterium]|nr:alpha/beta fold hydrolase [Candidatus Sumerlaeota bacterium]